MKKLILSSAIVLSALGLISAKLITYKTAEQLTSVVGGINDIPGYSASLSDMQTGWFSTRGKIAVELAPEALMNLIGERSSFDFNTVKFDIDFTTNSGLVNGSGLNLINIKLEVAGEALREYFTWEKDAPLYYFDGKVGVLGGLSYQEKISNFEFHAPKSGVGISLTGYLGQGETVGNQLVHHSELNNISYYGADFNGEAINLVADLQVPRNIFALLANTSFYDSLLTVSVESSQAEFTVKGQQYSLSIEGLVTEIVSDLDETTRILNSGMDYQFKALSINDWQASDFEFNTQFNNLDSKFFDGLNVIVNDKTGVNKDMNLHRIYGFVEDNLLLLLAPDPELNITKLSGTIPEGSFDLQLNSKISDVRTLPTELNNMTFWGSHLIADSRLELDAEVLNLFLNSAMNQRLMNNSEVINQDISREEISRQVEQEISTILEMLVRQGFIVIKGEKYFTEFTLKDKVADINGIKIPLFF
ncbi:hypothetical protein GCM10008107_23270 [Psychrosphaera saromensis]|uniref:DUF945 domain-containing protein n=1 Tax=Psychrosphaera saromensis TaxID=716813 RepID=A0A2S7UR09_9GAMM|nr:DUF945 family protein [Psychrosphaera saromensis]PQJ52367.1 hypothetical protein BTO11_01000 [Psychrosphaera saromensis]GHB73178.1 hypothetical protein GCM10008107_23270 [Psychrosphaera saromensis]GLQ13470.1 hypothetical protein GCM10007917_09250 [Psychrosphaera saromensis]